MRAAIAWPSFVLGIAMTSLSGAAWLVFAAHSDPSFAVEPDYYNKAVRWDETARQGEENRRLGWTIGITECSGDRLVIHLSDGAGRPIEGAAVGAVAFAHVRAADRADLSFDDIGGGGYSAGFAAARPGLWRFRFAVTHEGQTLTSEFDQSVRAPGEPGVRP